jgi:hypothetical protein
VSKSDANAGDRARADRSRWPVRRFRLGAEPRDDLRSTTSAQERLALMWPLALEAWALVGRAVPDYPRSEAPISTRPLRRPR